MCRHADGDWHDSLRLLAEVLDDGRIIGRAGGRQGTPQPCIRKNGYSQKRPCGWTGRGYARFDGKCGFPSIHNCEIIESRSQHLGGVSARCWPTQILPRCSVTAACRRWRVCARAGRGRGVNDQKEWRVDSALTAGMTSMFNRPLGAVADIVQVDGFPLDRKQDAELSPPAAVKQQPQRDPELL